jgi:hypothetical protein
VAGGAVVQGPGEGEVVCHGRQGSLYASPNVNGRNDTLRPAGCPAGATRLHCLHWTHAIVPATPRSPE